jgi:hypothetical protein
MNKLAIIAITLFSLLSSASVQAKEVSRACPDGTVKAVIDRMGIVTCIGKGDEYLSWSHADLSANQKAAFRNASLGEGWKIDADHQICHNPNECQMPATRSST